MKNLKSICTLGLVTAGLFLSNADARDLVVRVRPGETANITVIGEDSPRSDSCKVNLHNLRGCLPSGAYSTVFSTVVSRTSCESTLIRRYGRDPGISDVRSYSVEGGRCTDSQFYTAEEACRFILEECRN